MNVDSKTSRSTVSDRRMFLTLAAGAISSLSLFRGSRAQGVEATPRILKYTDHEPLGGMRTRFLKDVLFRAIEKESNGRLKIEDHWNGELASGYKALDVVGKSGGADMAIIVPEYTAKELPLHQVFKSFPKGPSGGKQVDFFRRVYARVSAFTEELNGNNIAPVFFATGYPVAFFSTKPLNTLDDLKGGKWRSASFWHQDYLKNAGATPVSMPWGPGIYDALKARTLDGLMVNVDSGYMLKVHEAAPNVLVSKDLWLGHIYILGINSDVWNELTVDDRAAIQRAAQTAYLTLGSAMDQSFDAQVDELRKGGASVRILSPNEVDRWQVTTRYRDIQAAWVQAHCGEGVANVGSTLDRVSAIMSDVSP